MDSDIDADTPVRMKPQRRFIETEHKSPTLPSYPMNMSKPCKASSPTSNYSNKSSKDQIDVVEIRRILKTLGTELDMERNKNRDLEQHVKHLEEQGQKLEETYKETLAKIHSNLKKKSDNAIRNLESAKIDELSQLQGKIDELTNKLLFRHNGIDISYIYDIVSMMEQAYMDTDRDSVDWGDLKKHVTNLKLALSVQTQSENLDSKLIKLRSQNNELTKIVKLLDMKLNKVEEEKEALKKKIEIQSLCSTATNYGSIDDDKQEINLNDTLQRANMEIIQLQKQIVWLKNSDTGDPATRERVEVLSNIIQSFKDNQQNFEVELSKLRQQCANVNIVTDELRDLKNENQKLLIQLREFSSLQKNIDILEKSLFTAQVSEREKLFEINKLESSNNRYKDQILSMDRLLKLKDQNQSSHEENSEESTENLKVKLREMEKRRTQQALNYEEALLELEALKKNNQRHNIDFNRRNGAKDDINNSAATNVMDGLLGNMEIGQDVRESSIFGRTDSSLGALENDLKYILELNNSGSNMGLKKEAEGSVLCNPALSLDTKADKQRKHIAAPIQIRIECPPNQPNNRILRWKSPEPTTLTEDCQITSYHIYVDGDFYKAVGASESLLTMLPNMDSKIHRVSIRSVCPHGQSKDHQCTIDINSINPAPSLLKANKITGTSAHISWMPSNSTLRHTVWVNGTKFCDCLPGVYKILLQGLTADSLQKIRVHPVLDQYPDNAAISAYLDFQTLPVSSETRVNLVKKQLDSIVEEIEAPKDVKLKLGNRSGKFLVKWMCSAEPASLSIKLVGYSILINNQCIALVNGAKNDRFTLNLSDLKGVSLPANQKLLNLSEQSYLPLCVRTLGTITETETNDGTVQSKDSQPPLKFSGQVAARIAGTAAEAAMMLGDKLAFFLNLIEGNADAGYDGRGFGKNNRSPKGSPAKISVPKIQITKDSSFSEDDENLQISQYKSKNRAVIDAHKDTFQQRVGPNQFPEYANKPNNVAEEQNPGKQIKHFQSSPTERAPMNQRPPNYNNGMTNNPLTERHFYGNQPTNDPIRYFVALYDYDPGTMSPNPDAINEELPFKNEQIIKVFGQVDEDGFYTGETNGRRGLVPSNMVKEVDNPNFKNKFKPMDNNNGQYVDRNQKRNKDVLSSRNTQPRPSVDQLSSGNHHEYPTNQFAGNQGPYEQYQVAHRKSTDSGASYTASDPNSYHKYQMPNTNVPRQTSTVEVSLNGKKMVALYDYDPQVLSPNVDSDAELAFKANDIIMIISEIDEDGFFVGERNGQRGLVPSNFLTEAVPQGNRLRNQQSFDGMQYQNQYKERNFSASSNLSDPPPARDTRFRVKTFENEREVVRSNQVPSEDYLGDRCLDIEHPKNATNLSYEESFDSGPPVIRPFATKPEPKHIPYHTSLERRGSMNNEPNMNANEHQYPRPAPISNQIPPRMPKTLDDRRVNQEKPVHAPQSSIKLPQRRQSPPPALEPDDMPIVMDLAPSSKDNQKKKKISSAQDNYRANLSETHENYGNNDGLYANSNSSMSDNLERKRSVFKNPFKKKKS